MSGCHSNRLHSDIHCMYVRYVPGRERAGFFFSNKELLSLESVRNEYEINTFSLQLISKCRLVVNLYNRILPNLMPAIQMGGTLNTPFSFSLSFFLF
jgi:hypothetical protein